MKGSNTFSYHKCYEFGKLIPTEYKGSWTEITTTQEWIDFKTKFGLTDNQLYYIKRGFMGKPFQDDSEKVAKDGDLLDDEIFPFGAHKGKKFGQLHDNYVLWLRQQEWINKWPTVAVYVNRRVGEINKDGLPTNEAIDIIEETRRMLKK